MITAGEPRFWGCCNEEDGNDREPHYVFDGPEKAICKILFRDVPDESGEIYATRSEAREYSRKIAASLNACFDMKDPVAEVAAMREKISKCIAYIEQLSEMDWDDLPDQDFKKFLWELNNL